MIRASLLSAVVLGSALLGLTPAASAQGVTYYLRSGSTYQQGCFIGCACWTSNQEPLGGTFVLTPTAPDPVFQNYAISGVQFLAATFNQHLLGSGTYQAGGDPAALQRMNMDLSIEGNPALHWDSLYAPLAASFPAIHSTLTIHNYQCYDIVLTLRATPFRSDWNADGSISVQDIFAFIGDWFSGNADANGDGATSLQDVFAFLNDWFARA